MLHTHVPVCFTYHLHVSMPVAQGSSRVDLQLCACSKRDSCVPVFLYALARGYTPRLHLNVVAELPGNGSSTQVEVPKVRSILVEATGIPGVLHSGEGDRRLSGTLHTGEDNRKRDLPGLDPIEAQWLASLFLPLSMVKEMMTTSNMEMNPL